MDLLKDFKNATGIDIDTTFMGMYTSPYDYVLGPGTTMVTGVGAEEEEVLEPGEIPEPPSIDDMMASLMPMFTSLMNTVMTKPPALPPVPTYTDIMFAGDDIPYSEGDWENVRDDIRVGAEGEIRAAARARIGLADTLLTSPLLEGSRPGNILTEEM